LNEYPARLLAIRAGVARIGENGRVITIGSHTAVRRLAAHGSVDTRAKAA
jgi:hypothetical protein